MDRDKLLGLPPTGRTTPPQTASFSHDLSRMPEYPPKNTGHRRAHSEILSLPDDICFDGDIAAVDGGGPSLSDDTEEDVFSMYIDMDKVSSETGDTSSEFRSRETVSGGRSRHQHSQSMDGSTMIEAEMFGGGGGGGGGGGEEVSGVEAKKAMSAAKLAELALIDPKRAKRIWANRQSAARSKERKMRYIAELERKVHAYQTEATSLSAQLTLLQRDTNGLTAENSELKIRLQTMEQQVHLQDTLNDALKEEIQHLKMLTGQAMSNGGPMMNFPASFGGSQPFYPNNQSMHTLLAAHCPAISTITDPFSEAAAAATASVSAPPVSSASAATTPAPRSNPPTSAFC
ncbi:hypothetical protein RND81_12G085400 [Saponaria officinalis]|uniref:BZIP domain-containing protein n=1 Tax=Saponaria officinalis TaxID=3572 RepID=A0AAW1H850_SAPOF